MTANKMPVLPEAVLVVRVQNTLPNFSMRHQPWTDGQHDLYTADQMRAMYLAGIADAKACVPEASQIDAAGPTAWAAVDSWNRCRAETLANLSALEQGVGK